MQNDTVSTPQTARPSIGVLILGGGEATRLPGKLELHAGELPMLVRVYRNVSPGRSTFVSCKATFAPQVDAQLPCPMVVDRWAMRGPLSGMVTTMAQMRTQLVFAVAGDAPFVGSAFIDALAERWEPGVEAVVPVHRADGEERLEPLAALYARLAFIREGLPVLMSGRGALRAVIDRLNARLVPCDQPRTFANVNTPQDYERVRAELAACP